MKLCIALALLGAHAAKGQADTTLYVIMGSGACVSATGESYAEVTNNQVAPFNELTKLQNAADWCSPSLVRGTYVGLELYDNAGQVHVKCLFSGGIPAGLQPGDYTPVPDAQAENDQATGRIDGFNYDGESTKECWRHLSYTNSPTMSPVTSAPTASPLSDLNLYYLFVGNGSCRDSSDDHYSYVATSINGSVDNDRAATWCNQHKDEPNYVGFQVSDTGQAMIISCLFSYPLPSPDLVYVNPDQTAYGRTQIGSGEIAKIGPVNSAVSCFKTIYHLKYYSLVGMGSCRDSTDAQYKYAATTISGGIDYARAAEWCNYNWNDSTYVGFQVGDTGQAMIISCLFDTLPTPDPLYVNPTQTAYGRTQTGSGEIAKIGPVNNAVACFKNTEFIGARTTLPTVAPTSMSPTTTAISFYSFVGNGSCKDRAGVSYQYVATSIRGSVDNDRAATWCNQHKDEPNYVGFQVSDTGIAMLISCLYTMDIPKPDPVYVNPPATSYQRRNDGYGEIAKIGPVNSAISCFKLSNTHAPVTVSPTTHSPSTLSPTSHAPVATQSPTTLSPTSALHTGLPTTHAPVATQKPTTHSPTSSSPTSHSPVSFSPTSHAPVTASPSTRSKSAKSAKSSKGTDSVSKSSKKSKKI